MTSKRRRSSASGSRRRRGCALERTSSKAWRMASSSASKIWCVWCGSVRILRFMWLQPFCNLAHHREHFLNQSDFFYCHFSKVTKSQGLLLVRGATLAALPTCFLQNSCQRQSGVKQKKTFSLIFSSSFWWKCFQFYQKCCHYNMNKSFRQLGSQLLLLFHLHLLIKAATRSCLCDSSQLKESWLVTGSLQV